MELYSLVSLAVVAGVVSFTSPCCLPLLPGYISYVTGLTEPVTVGTQEARVRARNRRRALIGAGLFVAGFTVVFTALGVTASALGLLLAQNLRSINVFSGGFVALMGLIMVGLVRVPLLYRRFAVDPARFGRGPASAMPLGAAFAFGWTPCVGPVLSAILVTAATTPTLARGAILLASYSVGLSIPFVLLALGLVSGRRRPEWLSRNSRRIEVGGGVLLVVMGIAIATGSWTQLLSRVLALYARIGWPPI